MPVRVALRDEVVPAEARILDYGSGRGQDVARLRAMGCDASGWDPYFDPSTRPSPSDVVFLTYVLNVIEDPHERERTLLDAWALAKTLLVVSTRLSWERTKVTGTKFSDGIKTSRATFQHLFEPRQLRTMVEAATGVPVVSPSPGVVYAFRESSARLSLLARQTLPHVDWSSDSHSQALHSAVDFAHARGRVPTFEEIPSDVLPVLGQASAREIARLVRRLADPDRMAAGAKRSTLDTLLFLGIDLFNGRTPFGALPVTVQADIRAHFRSYKEATQRADRLLLKLRDDTYLRGAMRNSVGKLTPSALYVHRRAVNQMPVLLRLYEHCGAVAAGRPPDFDIVKLSHDRRAVAWLGYPDFDSDPHPRTSWSYSVSFPEFDTQYTNYAERSNRPLLHRKEEFLAPDDPLRDKFQRLTRQEIRAGLYVNPSAIGTEDGWERELERCGMELRGHRLVSRKPSD